MNKIAVYVSMVMTFSLGAANAQENRVVIIDNETSYPMTALYASNVDTNDWEENLLRGRSVRSGRMIEVDIDDGSGHCYYDLKAVFGNASSAVRSNLNVCTAESWTIYD